MHLSALYIGGEVTSLSLWSRYDRHFVGITFVEVKGEDLSCHSNETEAV